MTLPIRAFAAAPFLRIVLFSPGEFSNLPNPAPVDLTFGGLLFHDAANRSGGEGNDLGLLWRETLLHGWGPSDIAHGFVAQVNSSYPDVDRPVQLDGAGLLTGKTIVQIARGTDHTLMLCSDDTLVA